MDLIYVDRHRISFGDLLIGGLVAWVFILGLMSGDMLQLALGLGFVVFLAFTRHKRYELTSNTLTIKFIGPREMIVPLEDIATADLVRIPMSGVALMIIRKNGRRVAISPTNADRFLQELRATTEL